MSSVYLIADQYKQFIKNNTDNKIPIVLKDLAEIKEIGQPIKLAL